MKNTSCKIAIGDTVRKRVDAIGMRLTGRVVYIHPKGRFYTVKFTSRLGSFCECFTEKEYEK